MTRRCLSSTSAVGKSFVDVIAFSSRGCCPSVSRIGCKSTQRCSGYFVTLTICLDACEFVRVGNNTNGLNPLCLHFNGQHEIGSITSAKDHCQLTIDYCQLNTGALG